MLKVYADSDKTNGADLLALLGKASGLGLALTGDTVEIRSRGRDEGVPSATLRARLIRIIKDKVRHAHVDPDCTPIFKFGTFGLTQNLCVVNVVSIEGTVPGLGVGIAIHEIWENYISWSGGEQGLYGPAHSEALAVERVVVQELTGRTGGRVAASTFEHEGGSRYVLDMETYFVVLTPKDAKNLRSPLTGRICDRTTTWSGTLTGLPGGRIPVGLLTDVVARLEADRSATACLVPVRDSAASDAAQAEREAVARANAVRNALSVAFDEDDYTDDDGEEVSCNRSHGQGSNLGARRSWTDAAVSGSSPGVRVEIHAPTG
jgi:hypothetical protein